MGRWRSFSEVLDGLLTDGVEGAAAPGGATSRLASTVAVHMFAPYLKPNRFWTAPGPYSAQPSGQAGRYPSSDAPGGRAASRARSTAPPRHSSQEPRRKRVLRPTEESALQTLIRLGAGLDRSYTAQELRSAFRELAHRYHPDRHPGASESERVRLGSTFAELTSAYGVLQAAAK